MVTVKHHQAVFLVDRERMPRSCLVGDPFGAAGPDQQQLGERAGGPRHHGQRLYPPGGPPQGEIQEHHGRAEDSSIHDTSVWVQLEGGA